MVHYQCKNCKLCTAYNMCPLWGKKQPPSCYCKVHVMMSWDERWSWITGRNLNIPTAFYPESWHKWVGYINFISVQIPWHAYRQKKWKQNLVQSWIWTCGLLLPLPIMPYFVTNSCCVCRPSTFVLNCPLLGTKVEGNAKPWLEIHMHETSKVSVY